MTILAEGNSLKDGSSVLAKIAPAQSNGSMCLEREAHVYDDPLTYLLKQTLTMKLDLASFQELLTAIVHRYAC
jgi:hypothetical protein